MAVRRAVGSGDVTVSGTVPSRRLVVHADCDRRRARVFRGRAAEPAEERRDLGSRRDRGQGRQAGQLLVLVAQTESDLLPTLAVINKRSQGFYAEQMFKTLAAEKAG